MSLAGAPPSTPTPGRLPTGKQAGYVVASTVPDGDMTTANDAGSGSHDPPLVCGTAIAPVLSSRATPGVDTPLPSSSAGIRPALPICAASFAASPVAVAWARSVSSCPVSVVVV